MALDFVKLVDNFKSFSFSVTIHPGQMSKFQSATTLMWAKEKFESAGRVRIPRKRGIYAFILESEMLNMPPHGYVMYVGITGDVSQHDLHARFGDYLREYKTNKRAHVHYMIRKWQKCLYFYYAVVSDGRVSLSKLERSLNDSLMPPFSVKDFSAKIRKAKRAFRT